MLLGWSGESLWMSLWGPGSQTATQSHFWGYHLYKISLPNSPILVEVKKKRERKVMSRVSLRPMGIGQQVLKTTSALHLPPPWEHGQLVGVPRLHSRGCVLDTYQWEGCCGAWGHRGGSGAGALGRPIHTHLGHSLLPPGEGGGGHDAHSARRVALAVQLTVGHLDYAVCHLQGEAEQCSASFSGELARAREPGLGGPAGSRPGQGRPPLHLHCTGPDLGGGAGDASPALHYSLCGTGTGCCDR